jgi:starch-binding outer membrane protein, SusD/RagB family
MKNKIIYILVISTILTSCDNLLDVKPIDTVESSLAIKTSSDVEGLLVGAYNALSDGDVLGGNMQRDAELLGDGGEIFWDGTFTAPGEVYEKKMLITNDQARQTWLDGYYCISICNQVLKNLNLVTADRVGRIEGEAKFIRGLVYFELVRLYAKTYVDGDPTNVTTNPGLPIITENDDPKALINRSSTQEVYDLVLADLQDASLRLPEINNFFATKYSAFAILSRVYLMQNDYAKATLYADSVIQSGEFSLNADFEDAFNKTSLAGSDRDNNGNASKEDVFSIQITSQDGTNNLNTFFASADFGGRGDIYINGDHFDLYQVGDERAELFYDDEFSAKFNNLFGNVPIVRLSEMYLTRAEGNKRADTSVGDSPLNDINYIRSRANLPALVNVNIDQILIERRLELAFEGHQLHDKKRTQRDIGDLSYNDPFLIFPIPFREITINPNLEQNEAYK